jgi:hypothetical protein
VGQFGLIINGEPVADPLIRLAALPTLIVALLFTVVLIILAFLSSTELLLASIKAVVNACIGVISSAVAGIQVS